MSKPLDHAIEAPQEPAANLQVKMQPSTKRILLCLVGGTAVWGLYFTILYGQTSLTCVWNWFDISVGGSGAGLKITQLVATVLALGLLAYFTFVCFREWQGGRRAGQDEEGETIAARDPMLAFVTMLVNILYILIIAVSLAPIIMLPTCYR